MIKIEAETTLYFNSIKINPNLLYRRLTSEDFEKFKVISHTISNPNHKLHINFIMYMHLQHLIKSRNYSSNALEAFKRNFPSIVKPYPFIIHNIDERDNNNKPKKQLITYYEPK
ncbi:hypothetical protein AOX59_02580 [Lentibacillus amyloliquefaciens]|uniref:Uncharacterized protein n=1 Tax=Lentibacillus amyloliquefaciens TaxID=1472767 RepID=A0A0U4E3V3_9BACI|nr:hypothetical protein AOX59_02580 [Lentibacillus amyloliquefaciens]